MFPAVSCFQRSEILRLAIYFFFLPFFLAIGTLPRALPRGKWTACCRRAQ